MKKKLKKKYIFFGLLIITLGIIIIMFAFNKSYALEGFGQLNLSCDKTLAASGEEISCILTGTVSAGNQVSSLSSQINLSENLEFVSFTVENDDTSNEDNAWQGNGNDGNIQLYVANNKIDNFAIGTFKVRVKEDITNTVENISLDDTFFYDETFEEQKIESTNIYVKTPQYKSNTLNLANNYVLVDTKNIENILSLITTEGCTAVIENEGKDLTEGEVTTNSKLKIVREGKTLKKYDIVYFSSNVYDLSLEYVITSSNNLLDIENDIEAINGSLSIKNNQLVLSYNNTGIKTYDIINLSSDVYLIDVVNDFIFIKDEINEGILKNINKSDNVDLSISNDKLNISYKTNIIKKLDILAISSTLYDINLIEKYIYLDNNKISSEILNNIKTILSTQIKDNKLVLSNESKELLRLDIINIDSDEYIIDGKNKYIYTKNITDVSVISKNLKVINASLSNSDDYLILNYNDNEIDRFKIYNFSTNNIVKDGLIYIKEEMKFDDFIQSINLDDLTYKVYDNNNKEVSKDNVLDGYKIEIYKNDDLLDTYNIKVEYLEINNLSIKDEKIIYNLDLNENYENLLKNFDTSGSITVLDKNGIEVSTNSKVKTSHIINIELNNRKVQYKISVRGDVTGSGNVSVGDVAKLYQYLKKVISMEEEFVLAGDVTGDGKIAIGDVAKLYQYLKGRISTLN